MTHVNTLRHAPQSELRARILAGYPVDPAAIEGWTYRGTSVCLPRLIERLTWKTFQKAFWRDPEGGRLWGWNVRLEQDGLDAPSRPRTRVGVPVTVWNYEVIPPEGVPMPRGFDRGLIIDYGRAPNPWFDTVRLVKDPLVAVEPGNSDLLLGVSYLALGRICLETPTYFLLERESPVTHVPEAFRPPRAVRSGPQALFPFERRQAELLFDAIVGLTDPGVSPDADHAGFWRYLGQYPPPYFATGLRAAVHALTWLPVTMPGFRRPMFALSLDARLACVERLEADERLTVRQMLSTLKVLACFALLEDETVRGRLSDQGGESPTAGGGAAPDRRPERPEIR